MGMLDGLLGQVLGGMMQGGNRSDGMPGMPQGLPGMPGMPDLTRMGAGGGPAGMSGGIGGAGVAGLLMFALQMLQQNGGLNAMLGRLQQGGLGDQANSWVGTGENMPVSPDKLSNVFGGDQIDVLAQQAGLSRQDAAGGLASLLPELINQLTPQGRVETGSDDAVAQALAMLRQRGLG